MTHFRDAVDLREILKPPAVGRATLMVPRDWAVWDELFMRVRDGINMLLGLADHVPGLDVPRLPDGSLADIVVKPLCGDWDRIRANGEACHILGRGMEGFAGNLLVLPVQLAPHWSGQTAVSFAAHHSGYALAVEAIARLVSRGHLVFEAVGQMSQRVGETAIRLLTRLGLLLARVVRKIATRLAPYVGWLATAKELLVDGVQPILDIVADIRETVELVHCLMDLVHQVRAWLTEAREDLSIFASLPALLDGLPRVGRSG
jgi:hypothetical protein